ncbi:MAG: hypothetical protein ACI4JV_01420 [Ruminiclostridium sp.]
MMLSSIMTLYNRKRDPLKLAVDMFESKILKELDEEALLTFKEMTSPLYYDEQATEDDDELYDWSKIRNSLFFTKDCMKIFEDDLITALWVAYESLRCIFKKNPDYKTSYMQVFIYNERYFWAFAENEHIVFITPEEY